MKKTSGFLVVFLGVVINSNLNTSLAQTTDRLVIVSPKWGTVVSPGDTLIVDLKCECSSKPSDLALIGRAFGAIIVPDVDKSVRLSIPQETRAGQEMLSAVAKGNDGHLLESNEVAIIIRPSLPTRAIRARYHDIALNGPGASTLIQVFAISDSQSRIESSIEELPEVRMRSTNGIVKIEPGGFVRAVAPGTDRVVIEYTENGRNFRDAVQITVDTKPAVGQKPRVIPTPE